MGFDRATRPCTARTCLSSLTQNGALRAFPSPPPILSIAESKNDACARDDPGIPMMSSLGSR